MTQYKVIDIRVKYRNNPDIEILQDNEKMFSFRNKKTNGFMILNPSKFQQERIVDEKEATLLILKGVDLNLIKYHGSTLRPKVG